MKKALIVDDSRHAADSLQQLLTLFDVPAEVAYSSTTALRAVENDAPSAVFLDINMPDMNGFDLLERFKDNPRLEDVPVIVITGDDQPETLQKVSDAAVDYMIVKPVTYELLESALKKANLLEEEST